MTANHTRHPCRAFSKTQVPFLPTSAGFVGIDDPLNTIFEQILHFTNHLELCLCWFAHLLSCSFFTSSSDSLTRTLFCYSLISVARVDSKTTLLSPGITRESKVCDTTSIYTRTSSIANFQNVSYNIQPKSHSKGTLHLQLSHYLTPP